MKEKYWSFGAGTANKRKNNIAILSIRYIVKNNIQICNCRNVSPPSLDDTQLEAQQIKHDWNILLTLSSSTIKAGVTIQSGYPAGEIEHFSTLFGLIVHTLSAGSNLK
jgi:hypothetical protein